MEKFKKVYLGKGKKVTNLKIIKVTVKLDDIKAIAYEYEGTDYVSFEIAEMINPDQYGRTHSVYYRKKVKLVSEHQEKAHEPETVSSPNDANEQDSF